MYIYMYMYMYMICYIDKLILVILFLIIVPIGKKIVELYGEWQTEKYKPKQAINGKVPRNKVLPLVFLDLFSITNYIRFIVWYR